MPANKTPAPKLSAKEARAVCRLLREFSGYFFTASDAWERQCPETRKRIQGAYMRWAAIPERHKPVHLDNGTTAVLHTFFEMVREVAPTLLPEDNYREFRWQPYYPSAPVATRAEPSQ